MSDTVDEMPEFCADLLGWFSITVLGIGARTGLLRALQQGPATATQLAERAGVDRRNALEWLRALAAINSSTYVTALVDEWIAGVPGLTETLSRGGVVVDLGCGDGTAAVIVGTAFPRTSVTGFDLNAPVGRDDLPPNVALVRADARRIPPGAPVDLVLCLDALHHFGDVAGVVKQVRRRLVAGGVLLVAEGGLSGHFAADVDNPWSVVSYATSLLYCLQENLAKGGVGRTDTDGWQWVIGAMSAADFASIKEIPSDTGFHVVAGVA